MNDYEMIFVPSVGSPQAGACCLTISESRGGLFPAVFEMLGYKADDEYRLTKVEVISFLDGVQEKEIIYEQPTLVAVS